MGKYLSILGGSFVTQVLNSMIPGTKKADSPKMFLFKVSHPISLFRLYSTIVPFEIVFRLFVSSEKISHIWKLL